MTVNDLMARLNDLNASGDMEVRVAALGGMRSGKDIESVSLGFDVSLGTIPTPSEISIAGEPADAGQPITVVWAER